MSCGKRPDSPRNTAPNLITALRIILAPAFALSVLLVDKDVNALRGLPLVIFSFAVATDLLDGFVARRFGQVTQLGTALDPIADKVLIITALFVLYLQAWLPPYLRMPGWVISLFILRDMLLLAGGLTLYYLKAHRDFSPSISGKIATFMQVLAVFGILTGFGYAWLIWDTALILSVISGLGYIKRLKKVLQC